MKNIAFLLAFTALPTLANAANLIANGSFEQDSQAAGTWGIYADLTGWTGVNNIELRNNVAGQASDGVNFVELDTDSNNSMFQEVATVIGATYYLTFDYSGRTGVPSESNPIDAFWNGTSLTHIFSSGIGEIGNHWTTVGFYVVGTGNDRLSFSASGISDSYGGSLDNVTLIAAVPEPETYAMMLAGLGLMGFVASRRKS